jgi:hypothetical protein
MEEGSMEKAIGGRLAWYQPPKKRPRTKDDDENEHDSKRKLC